MSYSIRELSARTYPDFEKLAMKQGECWCMYYQRSRPLKGRLSASTRKSINRKEKTRLVKQGKAHAVLVYADKKPVGWCQYGTQDELPRIDAGRDYKKVGPPITSERLWRITCFFVDRGYRRRGVAKAALKAALKSIANRGGGIVEGYPVVSKRMAVVPEWLWFGTPGMFMKEGFKPIAKLGTSRVLMRKTIFAKSS